MSDDRQDWELLNDAIAVMLAHCSETDPQHPRASAVVLDRVASDSEEEVIIKLSELVAGLSSLAARLLADLSDGSGLTIPQILQHYGARQAGH